MELNKQKRRIDFLQSNYYIINNVSSAHLTKILQFMYPTKHIIVSGVQKFYFHSLISGFWTSSNNIPLSGYKPGIEASALGAELGLGYGELLEPDRGTRVLVSDSGVTWQERIFLVYIARAKFPVKTVSKEHEKNFLDGNEFETTGWKQMKPIEAPSIVEVTLGEVAEKLGIPVANLRIKD